MNLEHIDFTRKQGDHYRRLEFAKTIQSQPEGAFTMWKWDILSSKRILNWCHIYAKIWVNFNRKKSIFVVLLLLLLLFWGDAQKPSHYLESQLIKDTNEGFLLSLSKRTVFQGKLLMSDSSLWTISEKPRRTKRIQNSIFRPLTKQHVLAMVINGY